MKKWILVIFVLCVAAISLLGGCREPKNNNASPSPGLSTTSPKSSPAATSSPKMSSSPALSSSPQATTSPKASAGT